MRMVISVKSIVVCLLMILLSACQNKAVAPLADAWRQPRAIQGGVRVGQDDTIYLIAWRYGHDYRELAAINGLSEPYTLEPGQIIYLVGPKIKPASKAVKPATAEAKPRLKQKHPGMVEIGPEPVAFKSVHDWRWPTQGKVIAKFGKRNKGIDIVGEHGQAVNAVAAGQVVYAGNGLPGYGQLLIIKHNSVYLSAYAHNSKLLAKEGNAIKAGQKIAEMGNSGADRVKLHFELRKAGKPVDPLRYLPKKIK